MTMIDGFVEQNSIPQGFSEEAQRLITLIRQYMNPTAVEHVMLALQLAHESCLGKRGLRLLPPLEHALAVATILAQTMRVDAVGVSAGLVFEAVDAELLPLTRVEQTLGAPTARVIGSMLRLNILERTKQSVTGGSAQKAQEERDEAGANGQNDPKKRRIREAMRRQQAETVRKMFVAMADDPRVVLLKLAYRLHAMRLMVTPFYPGDRQEMQPMAQEAREIYAPLAGRLGMSRVESELEELAFQLLEPETYIWVRNEVELEQKQWHSYVERVCGILREEMDSIGLKCEISGRVKHLYSFYKKLLRNADTDHIDSLEELKSAVDIHQIHDLIAFRILVASTSECYIALGHVHSLWRPKEGRIKDFVAHPKPNGYSALHTTVFCLDEQLVEVQIRTQAMHEMAEYGVAMHWHYKDVGDQASSSAKELLDWLRQLAEWQSDIRSSNTSDSDFVEAVKDDIFQEQIFVFTPRGEVKDLPVGSTPLDFAYRIHTQIGDTCAGARIITEVGSGDGDRLTTRMVPLDYELRSGEIVDIITSRTAHPTRDWLNFARTTAARNKIRRYLKTHERHINIQIGRERLDRDLKLQGIVRGIEAIIEDAEHWLCNEYHVAAFEDLLVSIGADDVRPHAAVVKLLEYWQLREGKPSAKEPEESLLLAPAKQTSQTTSAQLQVAGESGLLTKLANCCFPLPGDEIAGFISRGKGVIVHRTNCYNLHRYRDRENERLIAVSWLGVSQTRYLAPIMITVRDRPGLIRDISAVVSEQGINITSVSSLQSREQHETKIITVTLEIENMEQLPRLFLRLERVKSVLKVERSVGKQ